MDPNREVGVDSLFSLFSLAPTAGPCVIPSHARHLGRRSAGGPRSRMSTSLPDCAVLLSVLGRARARFFITQPPTGRHLLPFLRLQTCLPCSTWAAPPDAVALLASAAADWRTPGCAFAILRGYSWYVEVGNADCFLSCYPEQHSLQHCGASGCTSSGRGEQHLGSTTDESCCCATYFAGCALRVCLSVRGFLNSAWHIDRAPARGLALTGRTASRAGLEPLAGRQTGR